MGFNMNNNYNNTTNNGGGEKKKTNFRIAKIWGSDGQLDISVWVSDTGVKTILSIKSAVGKDPSTGANVFEQKMPNELPRFFMNVDLLCALNEVLQSTSTSDYGTINISLNKSTSEKMTIVGQGNSIKITIDTSKNGSRTITLDSIAVGSTNVHASFKNFTKYIGIAYKKALTAKLDPDEFAMVAGGSDEDAPF